MKKTLKFLILTLIKDYQEIISPFLGHHCRFYPSCSQYSRLTIEKHGIAKGLILSFWRLLRCGPWSKGGIDIP